MQKKKLCSWPLLDRKWSSFAGKITKIIRSWSKQSVKQFLKSKSTQIVIEQVYIKGWLCNINGTLRRTSVASNYSGNEPLIQRKPRLTRQCDNDQSMLLRVLVVVIFPGNWQSFPRGPAPSCQPRTDVLLKNNKRLFSICPPPPYLRVKTSSNNSPPLGPKGWTCPGGSSGW